MIVVCQNLRYYRSIKKKRLTVKKKRKVRNLPFIVQQLQRHPRRLVPARLHIRSLYHRLAITMAN